MRVRPGRNPIIKTVVCPIKCRKNVIFMELNFYEVKNVLPNPNRSALFGFSSGFYGSYLLGDLLHVAGRNTIVCRTRPKWGPIWPFDIYDYCLCWCGCQHTSHQWGQQRLFWTTKRSQESIFQNKLRAIAVCIGCLPIESVWEVISGRAFRIFGSFLDFPDYIPRHFPISRFGVFPSTCFVHMVYFLKKGLKFYGCKISCRFCPACILRAILPNINW